MSEAVELAGKDVPVATVREHTTRASQVVTLFAIIMVVTLIQVRVRRSWVFYE